MFKNVLVGVDGTASGRDAIALASLLLDADGKLTLAHVFSRLAKPLHAVTRASAPADRAQASELLSSERAQAGPEAELVAVDAATPGRGLHEEAERQNADLLVLGTCHRGVLGRTLLGDDTRAALDGAPCAVAIAPAGFARHASPLSSIGVGYDGSPESAAAVETARALAAPRHASVRALELVSIPYYEYTGLAAGTVTEGGDMVEQRIVEAENRMGEISGVKGEARYGLAGEELAGLSGEVDLTIVGSRGYGPARRLIMGSTSHYLERHARGPLLILPRGTPPPRSIASSR
ncbi:MAG TPA: universal stress protein [Solirubrobacteraceae bacterium]|nr:universal stress protein [Solirubrobacteraceae bacterium]